MKKRKEKAAFLIAAFAFFPLNIAACSRQEFSSVQKAENRYSGMIITENYRAGEFRSSIQQNRPVNEANRIAITFDDGPHPEFTPQLLSGLKERGVRATFFLVGSQVEQYPQIVRQMAEDGHLIGSHTYSHVSLTSLSLRDACYELSKANQAIFDACGQTVTYVRPPYGLWSDTLNQSFELIEVGWTIDPEDWKVLNADKVVNHVLNHAEDGSIILLHDIYGSSVKAALRIIDCLQDEGWEFVGVDELLLD